MTPEQEAEVLRRLDRQAEVIRDLRARVSALEAGDSSTPGAVVAAGDLTATGTWGVFVPNPCCVVCGIEKNPGRTELTCQPCGRARQDGILGNHPKITYTRCGNCGKSKGANTTILCGKCSTAYAKWKASA